MVLAAAAASYHVPQYHLGGADLLAQSVVLGLVIGALSALVIKGLRWFVTVEEWNARLAPFMPLIVLGTLGIAAAWLPQLLGNGYDVAEAALNHELGLSLLVALPVLRFWRLRAAVQRECPVGCSRRCCRSGRCSVGWWARPCAASGPTRRPRARLLARDGRAVCRNVARSDRLGRDRVRARRQLPPHPATRVRVWRGGAGERARARLAVSARASTTSRRRASRRRSHAIPLHPTRKIPAADVRGGFLLAVSRFDPRPMFVVDERGRLRGVVHPDTARARLAAESLPRLLIVDDLTDRDVPRLSVRASLEEARALFARHALPPLHPGRRRSRRSPWRGKPRELRRLATTNGVGVNERLRSAPRAAPRSTDRSRRAIRAGGRARATTPNTARRTAGSRSSRGRASP